MGRNSCFVKPKLRKGLWSPEEDEKLFNYITRFGVGCWSSVPKLAGLQRCGKSCRLRWINYLRPDLKRGMFSQQEEDLIIRLHEVLGNRWAQIAAQLPGRTDNEIKNFWNSCLKKKLMKQGIDPNTHKPLSEGELRDENNCTEKALPQFLPQINSLPNLSTSPEMEQQFLVNNTSHYENGLTRENFSSKPVFDPLFMLDFQTGVDPIGQNSNLSTQYQQTLRPVWQSQFEENQKYGFHSMPDLTNFDYGKMGEADFSDTSASRMSSFVFNEAKESSSNSSNVMNNIVENAAFMWEAENSLFQNQFNETKSEEMKPSTWQQGQLHSHHSEDFSSYPLTSLSEDLTGANLEVFQHI